MGPWRAASLFLEDLGDPQRVEALTVRLYGSLAKTGLGKQDVESRSFLAIAARRGVAVFEDIRRAGHEAAVVVSHGGLLVSTIKSLLGIPLREPPLALENCSITTLAWYGDGRVELAGLDQVEHLATIGHGGIGDLAV